ncbi:Cullin-4 [Neolecta irregularis DAH-3]|uniref:Cullin-4 n=1 Tax=Neolecta irregularis (strain DAH-3) TaxID=1198029 RepID=A0A1U7LTJ2_NEOID|nr:Cullin-4 [Neolecta irregularis DAH-3]|eukprot:OLL25995.1 Cullin-4 [Neolecta irregularis DAH-3]
MPAHRQKTLPEAWPDAAAKRQKTSFAPVKMQLRPPQPSPQADPALPPLPKRRIALRPANGPAKLVIKNIRPPQPENQRIYLDQSFDRLRRMMLAVLAAEGIEDSLQEAYKGAEALSRANRSADIQHMLEASFDSYFKVSVSPEIHRLARIVVPSTLLQEVNRLWDQWLKQLSTIRGILQFHDQNYCWSTPNVPTIWVLGTTFFRDQVITTNELQPHIIQSAIELLKAHRDGDRSDSLILKATLSIFNILGIYSEKLYDPLRIATSKYHTQLAQTAFSELLVEDYLKFIDDRLQQEEERCVFLSFDKATRNAFVKIIQDTMIRQKALLILEEGFQDLMERKKHDSLHLLYTLLQRTEQVKLLQDHWSHYILSQSKGVRLVTNPELDNEMIDSLLAFKKELDTVISTSFSNTVDFVHTLRRDFENFINKRQNKPAEMAAKYLDGILRRGNKAGDDFVVEQKMDHVIEVFKFIQGKDVFEAFYKRDLAKRLLLNKSASDDLEKSMFSRLREECGSQFTQNLETMFKDVKTSADMMEQFRNSKHRETSTNINVRILTHSSWPEYKEVKFRFPETLSRDLEIFKQHYKEKSPNKNLEFRHALDYCVVTANLPRGTKELHVSLFQGAVLLLFNNVEDGNVLTYEDIQGATSLADQELIRTMQSLSCGKFRILTKSPKGKEVKPDDTFQLNESFTDKQFRIKINQIQLKETKEENEAAHKEVEQNRTYEMQSAVVRVMKARQRASHHDLVLEVISIMKARGALNVKELKKVIEKLIDDEYIEREEDGTYKYLA